MALEPVRSFLDANILSSAAYGRRSLVSRLCSFDPAEVVLMTSDIAIREATRNLPPSALGDLFLILNSVDVVPTPPSDAWISYSGVVLPEKADPILQAAFAANASHLITGDRKHFGAYFGQRIGSVFILKPEMYRPVLPGYASDLS